MLYFLRNDLVRCFGQVTDGEDALPSIVETLSSEKE